MINARVIFEIPLEFVKGLKDGTLERRGGVIREAGSKRVVAWLKEVEEPLSRTSSIPSILASPQMLMGMQVVNLAVNVAGFALIYRKLQNVERQIREIDKKLGHLADDYQFLDQKQVIAQLARMVGPLHTLAEVHRINDQVIAKDKLISADDKLGEVSVYFKTVLERMLVEKLEHERPDEFAAYYRAWVMAAQGHIHTMAVLGEIPVALDRAKNLKLEHQSFGREYLAVRRDPLRGLVSERTQDHADAVLMELGQQCAGVHELIGGKVLQLDHMRKSDFRLEDLPNTKGSEGKEYALLYFE